MVTSLPLIKYYPLDHKLISEGTKTRTYMVGKIVPVEILKGTPAAHKNIYGPSYRVKYIGTEVVSLDFGQNWYLRPGDEFEVHQNNIDAAIKDTH